LVDADDAGILLCTIWRGFAGQSQDPSDADDRVAADTALWEFGGSRDMKKLLLPKGAAKVIAADLGVSKRTLARQLAASL
jgi:hypothetical protein